MFSVREKSKFRFDYVEKTPEVVALKHEYSGIVSFPIFTRAVRLRSALKPKYGLTEWHALRKIIACLVQCPYFAGDVANYAVWKSLNKSTTYTLDMEARYRYSVFQFKLCTCVWWYKNVQHSLNSAFHRRRSLSTIRTIKTSALNSRR